MMRLTPQHSGDAMTIRIDLPQRVRVIAHQWVTLSDGCRLAARIWLPEDAERRPVPALLEYIPYRKNDGTARRDALRHPYLAGHGYATVRVDMRGSGDSDGILLGEYLEQEQDDALEVLAWIAAQPWCTGSVGMFGKSWGGFNALQVAARRPPQLKAILTIYSTDDRYADDVHYSGGCVLGSDMLEWASIMLAYNARPADPAVVGEAWRAQWLERMERTPPYVEEWLRHQRRDAFWRHGSVADGERFGEGPFGDITCPVYAVGGWADGYTSAVLRLLAGLRCPRKGLIGPWSHEYPEVAEPGPAIGFLQESLRWWDYWLKGADTGIMDEPQLRVWLQESVPPATYYAARPGRWVAEDAWPSPRIAPAALALSAGGRLVDGLAGGPWTVASAQTHGLDAGIWVNYGAPGDYPSDQRGEDSLALCFDAAPSGEPQDILGFPELTVELAADQPLALLAVRLCDVAPGGESLLVSRGLLNLTHRNGHDRADPLTPGERVRVTVRLNAAGHRLLPGHRWRVALAPTYRPPAWPSPVPVTLTVYGGELALPLRPERQQDAALAPFGPPETTPPLLVDELRAPSRRRVVTRDMVTGEIVLEDAQDQGCFRIRADGLSSGHAMTDRYHIAEGRPLAARAESAHTIELARGEWRVRIETASDMTADATHFHVTNRLEAYEGEARVFAKTWHASIARDGG
jgi:putative CocE/NonD family hydrolase